MIFLLRSRSGSAIIRNNRKCPILGGIDMAKIKPLGEKIVVKRLEAKEKSAGGIVLPDAAK